MAFVQSGPVTQVTAGISPNQATTARVMAICAGDSWIDKGANLILIGGPGGGKTHLVSAIGLALVENGCA